MSITKKWVGRFHATFALIILIFTTFLGFIPILFLGLLKLVPYQPWRLFCTKQVDRIAVFWSDLNNTYLSKTQPLVWEISGIKNFKPNDWYLVIANHQSWLDIVVLQKIFNRKIPVLKFFIKDQLKWIPFLGFSWWAMGCPFMKRYSKAYLAKHPHKKGKDLQATEKAIQLFQKTPASIMSFIEGTRYTVEKKQLQQSPYKHLLKPKAGGVSFVISSMNSQVKHILDVTIAYPSDQNSLWDFLCRRMKSIKVHVRELHIPSHFSQASLLHCEKLQQEFREWLNQRWLEKDALMQTLKG